MKKIALDLDGVVFDSENLYRVLNEIYDVEVNRKDTMIDCSKRTWPRRYNWDEKTVKDFYDKYFEYVMKTANIMPGADLVIDRLLKEFEIIIVTARPQIEIDYSIDKLKLLHLDNVPMFLDEHSKIDRIINEKCDYIIDDDEDICLNASQKNIKAIYLKNNASNKLPESEYIVNVNNWGEIYKKFFFYKI